MTGAVLILDDSLTVRMDLVEAFEAVGFRTIPCATVAEARQALARGSVVLAVLDILLPDGDGVELLKEIRQTPATANTPILLLSSEAEVKSRIIGLQTGADDYVGKPYDTGYVVARARDLLRGREGPSPLRDRATILIIDDSPTFREELRHALDAAGYAVLMAANGEEGLLLAALNRPSAVVVDGAMPRIDGVAIIRQMKLDAALRGTPCVFLTGSDENGDELRALDAGADVFVRKSDDLGVILARIAAVLRTSGKEKADTSSLLGPKRILAVDDSNTYLEELATVLRVEGYDVVLAHSGEEALELLTVQQVDCILLDLLMTGLGGKETCRRIKALPILSETPLIVLTAHDDRAAMIDGLGAGADDFILKSSEFEILKARVRTQIRRKQFEDEHRKIREDLLRSEFEASEARAASKTAEVRAALAEELQRKNTELEAFSYSVSHDLRAPLRAIIGFSEALFETAAGKLDEREKEELTIVRESAARMGHLIDDMLMLARASVGEVRRTGVNLTTIATDVIAELRQSDPERQVEVIIEEGLLAQGDTALLRIALTNLLGNAWKFTSQRRQARIEFGATVEESGTVYFVRDNGAGFNMHYAAKLFGAFQRLHTATEFPGTGIGLATVQRVIARHGGRVWAKGTVDQGAVFFFTL
jgi:two-component system, NtrC family, sensor kinase